LTWRWPGCAASPTPPDHRCQTAPAPTPDRASASLPGHARPAARVLRIASNRPPCLWIMLPAHPQPSSNRPRKRSNQPGIRASDAPYL
jgi:hypothetical protein